jgi:agmatinase
MASGEIILLGIPYEGKENFLKGTREAPFKIRWSMESIEDYSPYQKRSIPLYTDFGDLNIPQGSPREVLEEVEKRLEKILDGRMRPLFIGGDHTITWATFGALHHLYKDLVLLHLDAHLDRRDQYKGERLNHATVMRRIEERFGRDRILSFGIRSVAEEELGVSYARELGPLPEELKGKPLYLSLDLDVLDPSQFPAVGNPEPGGVTFKELLDWLFQLKGRLVGAELVEINPSATSSIYPFVTAAVLVRELLILLSG